MATILFPISKVKAIRTRATKACPVQNEGPDGWSKSQADPMKLLAVFKALKIKPAFVLRAYQYRSGGNGNGVIWAMPADAPFPDPDECPKLTDRSWETPKPPLAVNDLMDTIEGDGTPWSYLSASIFAREADEFGAMWHGCSWSTHTILGADPFDPATKHRRRSTDTPSDKPDEWTWILPKPESWEPSFEQTADVISISFLTFSGMGRETINRWTDSFRPGGYQFDTANEVVAEGPGGYVF